MFFKFLLPVIKHMSEGVQKNTTPELNL